MLQRILLACLLPTVLLLAAPVAAPAAMLRPLTLLSAPVVLLSDLFDDAGEQAARPLGPAPAPGQSIIVEAPQLAAIARQFGVAWHPASPGDRSILQRRGTALPRGMVVAAVRAALAAQGAGEGAGEGDLDLPDFDLPVVAPEARAHALVEQLAFDAPSGRFSAGIAVEGDDMLPLHLRLSGRVVATESVLVADHRLAAGTPLAAADLRPARIRSATLAGEVVRAAAQAEGLAPRRTLAAGQPVALADLAPPVVVARGARVAVSLAAPGLELSSIGEALEAGAVGSRIRVLNPVSRAVLIAAVTGAGAVRVEPGSLPARPSDEAAGHLP